MKKLFLSFLISCIIAGAILLACKKEKSCEGCKVNNKPPIAIAGPDQLITLPTDSISVDGTASADPDGTISEWLWKKIEGPASFAISNASVAKTKVKHLVAGLYTFELTVTDNKGAAAKDTMMVTVDSLPATNHPPVANAGTDQTILSPTNIVHLDGSASTDVDNNITNYQWTKIAGPSSFTIVNSSALQTQVTSLVEGLYQFELKVTDAGGLFDRDTVTVQVTVSQQPSPPPPCITNCGKIVFVSNRDRNDEIYTCNADGSNVTRLTNNPAADGQPAWSPDGTRIVFVRSKDSFGQGDVYLMNADGSNLVRKTFSGNCIHPAWSPDGMRIAFNRMDFNGGQVVVMELSTGSMATLPNSMGSSVEPSPAWSPDGTKIAFDSDWSAWDIFSDIFTISPNGGNRSLLTSQFFNDSDYWKPAWSPNGSKLSVSIYRMVYQGGNISLASIGVMNQDGTGLKVILTGNMGRFTTVTKTSWSPDGERIAYTSWAADNTKTIKWVAADGSSSGTIINNGWDADWKH
ncbi:PKD domain-containing protein [Chitinophagaceae bacterium 26-R-25]|nr:PKD domain-containing protein [Chitinophagaceae bacterium 26-R-25]